MNRERFLMMIGVPMAAIGIFGYASSLYNVAMARVPAVKSPARMPARMFFGGSPASSAGDESIGVVHLKKLLQAHPLAPVLATDDRQLYTLRILAQNSPPAAHVIDHSRLAATQKRLELQLRQTAEATQAHLKARAAALTAEEQREITALLDASGAQPRQPVTGANAMLKQTDAVLNDRAQSGQRNFLAGISAEQRAAVATAEQGLEAQSRPVLEAKAASLSQEESALAAKLAQDNADERLRLRIRENDLNVAPAEKTEIAARLKAMDDDTRTQLNAKRAQDAETLRRFGEDLREHHAVAANIAADNAETAGQGAADAAKAAAMPDLGPLPDISVTAAPVDTNLKARVAALQRKYQDRFNAEQAKSMQAFQAKRASLQAQFTALEKADLDQRQDSAAEVRSLNFERERTYGTMIGDIRRAISDVAAQRHLRVVLVDPLGTGPGSVDVTDDVIKTLTHEVR